MKHYVFFFFFCLLAACALAQERTSRHEVFAGYGAAPLVSLPGTDILCTSANTHYVIDNKRFWGAINVGYLYHFSRNAAVGIAYSYASAKRDVSLRNAAANSAVMKNDCHSVMLTGKYAWLHSGRFSLYSRVGLGLMLVKKATFELDSAVSGTGDEKDFSGDVAKSKTRVAWQAMPLAAEYSLSRHLYLFLEAGAGTSGCGIAGVKVCF